MTILYRLIEFIRSNRTVQSIPLVFLLNLLTYVFISLWSVERGWHRINIDSNNRNYLIATTRKTGTNAIVDIIYMLLTSHSIGTIKKNDIKSSIRGQAPITSFVVDSNTVYICHDLPLFSWRKLLKFDLVISTHRDLDEMLTSSLDYYFVRRRVPILRCPFDLLLLRKWQYFMFERRMKRLQGAEIPAGDMNLMRSEVRRISRTLMTSSMPKK